MTTTPQQPNPPENERRLPQRRATPFGELVVERRDRPGFTIVPLPYPDQPDATSRPPELGRAATARAADGADGTEPPALEAVDESGNAPITRRPALLAPRTVAELQQRALTDPTMRHLPHWAEDPDFAEQRDRVSSTWISRESAASEVVAYFDASELIDGFVREFTKICETGIIARLVPGMVSLDQVDAPVDLHAQRRDAVTKKLAAAKRAAANLTNAIGSAEHPAAVATLTTSLTKAHRDVDALTVELADLSTRAATVRIAAPAIYTDVIEAALRRLNECDNRVSQEEKIALQAIIPVFRVDRLDDGWWATAFVRANEMPREGTRPGVVEFGPLHWRLRTAAVPIGTHLLRRMNPNPPLDVAPESRTALAERLHEAGLPEGAYQAALNGPRELALVLLHRLAGEALPAAVGAEWRDPVFGEHLVKTWAAEKYTWFSLGRYTVFRHVAQAVLDYAAAHETFTVGEAAEALYILDPGRITDLLRLGKGVRARRFEPVLQRVGPATGRLNEDTVLRGIHCVCGQVASVVCRRYEVQRDLLCGCGRMPNAEKYGLPRDFRFPANYLLRPTPEEVLATCRNAFEERRDNTSVDGVVILTTLHAAAHPVATPYLIEAIEGRKDGSRSRTMKTLQALRRFDLVVPAGSLRADIRPGAGAGPMTWALTALGAERAEEVARRLP